MNKNKKWIYFQLASAAFLIGLILMYVIYGRIKNFDKEHTQILIPILAPIIGVVIGTFGVIKRNRYVKLICLLTVLANLGLASIIFISYSFSYWQF